MNKISTKIVFTDLDGTLLNSKYELNSENRDMLKFLGEMNIYRVAVTGRNLYSLAKVIKSDDPFDFVIFSTGAGILDWSTKELVHSKNLESKEMHFVSKILIEKQINFMLHHSVPDNHRFYYYHDGDVKEDFLRRLELYRKFSEKYEVLENLVASQFLVILDELEAFEMLQSQMKNVKVVRATSPLDHQSIWMEIFHNEVSKGKGCKWLCEYLDVDQKETASFGNDYNDIDMLAWTAKSFVVDNAAEELKQKYEIIPSNNDNGFAKALKKIMNKEGRLI
jgi:Cof subfamily protein (haloacid dehalogenase superfamily)